MYEMQKQLDARIIKEKGLEGQDLLPNTVLALQVEIGELANEWRGFKHWSNDREPRYEKRTIAFRDKEDGTGDAFEHVKYPLLEEYVDCLHFFLSIARQLDLPADDLYIPDDTIEGETTVLFTELLHNVGMIMGHEFLYEWPEDFKKQQRNFFRGALAVFYSLGEQRLGFTFEQIADAYAAKNAVNHERQSNGY
ncbi:dUTP diphosphatase [Paenibacillus phocaensis]|uniref:dUTP diphosphatase n=1 Tax=Paenibacillus phocaensis TaxID=1776378 RepID=UPI001E5AF3FB|nr:dUTP diphosphatase [Paenibacillus phocaensis]